MDAGPVDPDKPFAALLSHATILDQLRLAYPQGAPIAPPGFNFDPGRFRNAAFFNHMYGDCRKGEVEKHLTSVVWLPRHRSQTLRFTAVNGAADRLREVSAEIDVLPPSLARAAYPSAGTYSCRGVADAGQPSMHAYGAAIDLNLKVSDYWLWEAGKAAKIVPYRNRMPKEIVDIFERHGFIWGGRWYHYDTMHFEYRPELLNTTR
ncbi:MAG: M15 family metallopeptidase [Proteobacteria bacterium]|nr:M15 family metallopeptidase [Pseudomonadota bacterium]